MTIEFPLSLPGVLLSAFQIQSDDYTRTNDVQSGPPKVMLATSDRPRIFSVVWSLSQSQATIFEEWYSLDSIFGSVPFTIVLPTGAGLFEHTCYFHKPYSLHRVGKRIRIATELRSVSGGYGNTSIDACRIILNDLVCAATETLECAAIASFTDFCDNVLPTQWGSL